MSAFRRALAPPVRASIAIAILATSPACASRNRPDHIPVLIGGRVVVERDGSMRFGWPGVYFEGRFKGTGLNIVLRTGTDRLRLLIDGVERRRFERPGSAIDASITGLSDGEHSFRLEKLAETQGDSSILYGFYPIKGGRPLPPPPRKARSIEFIGDSYSVGYGNMAPGRVCTPGELRATTDTQQAFGPVVARHFGAEYRINAYSGFGVVRNYGGTRPGESMPGLYRQLIPADPTTLETASRWRPQVIVVNLGTNDFSTPLHAGERWPDEAALRLDYRARYVAFVNTLLKDQPRARIILMASDVFRADVEQIAATLRRGVPGRVSMLRFGGLDLTGCDGHPSRKDHKLLARLIQSEIERIHPPRPW